jgi:DNA repair protein RadC
MTQTDTIAEIELVYKPSISNKPIISSPLDAYNVFMNFYPKDTLQLQEHFFVAYLNRFNRVLGVLHLSSGGITGTIADIRLIFGTALKAAACSLVISHNHPSGNINPSERDKEVTKKIRDAGDMLDIKLMDYIIVGHEGQYLSFSDEGL